MPKESERMTNEQRALRARIAAHTSWANTADPAARTEPARLAFDSRFEREVDPEGLLSLAERARRAESARKAYFLRLASKSAAARRGTIKQRAVRSGTLGAEPPI